MRRTRCTLVATTAALLLALAGVAGCADPAPGRVADSQMTYERTYDIAFAAMADQRLTFSVTDRRQGRIVGSIDGITLVATIQPIVDGTTRVQFVTQADTAADTALLAKVSEAYDTRMAKLGVLGGFKDAGGASDRGPVPCPSGPAFCP